MQTIQLKYGKGELSVQIPKRNLQDVLHGEFPSSPTPEQEAAELLRALREPIGAKPLREMAKPGMKVVIMASDITRPSPSYKILPVLVDELNSSGVRDEISPCSSAWASTVLTPPLSMSNWWVAKSTRGCAVSIPPPENM